MPTFNSQDMLRVLQRSVEQNVIDVRAFAALSPEAMLRQPAAGAWSIAQIIEHLNVYNRFYLRAIGERLLEGSKTKHTFKTGWLGAYFTALMEPGADGQPAKAMQAPGNAQPDRSLDAQAVLQEYLAGQKRLAALLEKAVDADLDVRVPTSLTPLIRLKMGDTFRFLIAHQNRHAAQMRRAHAAVLRTELA